MQTDNLKKFLFRDKMSNCSCYFKSEIITFYYCLCNNDFGYQYDKMHGIKNDSQSAGLVLYDMQLSLCTGIFIRDVKEFMII